ncbi:MAG: hypothetical protein PHR16_00960 [Methylovulum sp.]|nr:hypothetical protein [Methylovulum sp.]
MTTKHTKLLITLVAAGLTIGSGIAIYPKQPKQKTMTPKKSCFLAKRKFL